MDFNFNEEQEILRRIVHDFIEREIEGKAFDLDDRGEFPRDIVKKIAGLGILGTVFPEKYGGSGIGHLARILTIEEISRAYPSMGLFLQATPIGLWAIFHFGNERQKQRYIPPVLEGREIMCMAVTEPTGGSDPTSINTKAMRRGDEYIVNGSKCFITNGDVADTCVFVAKTGGTSRGLSVFVVEKGTPGFTVGIREKHAGFRSIGITELFFEDCCIPSENFIGKEGEGLKAVLKAISEIGRMGNAGVALGIAEAAYETALEFALERQLYRKPLFEIQAIRFMLADMNVEIEAAKWLTYYAAWLLDERKHSREISKEIASAKLYTAEVARRTALKAVQIQGASGTLPEFKAIRYLLDALETIAAGGTNEIMRVIIGRNLK
ncbi:acyl-CoA dehydrogenase family protein [Candidatus Bathyarchaeota archaeon]|nr:acyl-CoA dehydrogenase family protein [Candidatus Bathyarchaeota archaeon]